MRSESAPKATNAGAPIASAAATSRLAVVSSTLSCSVRKKSAWYCPVYQTTACPATSPNSAIRTTLSFPQLPKASVSGAREERPACLMRRNAGDSLSCSRIHTLIASSTTESRNGMRQPQSAKRASPRASRVPTIMSSARSRPMVAVPWIQPV